MTDLPDIRETDDGLILAVQGQPGSRKNGINGVHNGRLKVAVTQVAEKGKANQQILKLLAKHLGISKSQLTLITGETSSQKSILITGLDRPTLETKLRELL